MRRYITLIMCFSSLSFAISTSRSSFLTFVENAIFKSFLSDILELFLINIATPPTLLLTGS